MDIATRRDVDGGQRILIAVLLIFVWPIGLIVWSALRGHRLSGRPIIIGSLLVVAGVVAVGLVASFGLTATHSSMSPPKGEAVPGPAAPPHLTPAP